MFSSDAPFCLKSALKVTHHPLVVVVDLLMMKMTTIACALGVGQIVSQLHVDGSLTAHFKLVSDVDER